MKKLITIAATTFACTCSQAGWQGVQWGMTVSQVRTAHPAFETGRLIFGGTTLTAELDSKFSLAANFTGGRLTTLSLTGGDIAACNKLTGDLNAKYGTSTIKPAHANATMQWDVEADNNRISYIPIKDNTVMACLLKFAPLRAPKAQPLV